MTRIVQESLDIKVDGYLGDDTRRAVIELERTVERTPGPPLLRDIVKVFGNPGTKQRPNKAWRKANIITVRDLPGVPSKWFFKCHTLIEPALREGLRRAEERSKYKIERAGCFVLRHIRHNPSNPLSLHSWGVAIDIDAKYNRARKFRKGSGPVPFTPAWRALWPYGVDKQFVEAMESAGFRWGGVWGKRGDDFEERSKRCKYFDPMHFEYIS